jgi:hypothetical protein
MRAARDGEEILLQVRSLDQAHFRHFSFEKIQKTFALTRDTRRREIKCRRKCSLNEERLKTLLMYCLIQLFVSLLMTANSPLYFEEKSSTAITISLAERDVEYTRCKPGE